MRLSLPWLGVEPDSPFPPAKHAFEDPPGLLAAGGDLSPARLLNAYRHGIFPWFSEGQPPLWWCPDPRMVFESDAVHVSRRLKRQLRETCWKVRADTAFDAVIAACAHAPRAGQSGTWITPHMQSAYCQLHRMGHAHSMEVFDAGMLVGGLYGVAIGRMFFAESMFSARSGGSKVALAGLAHRLHAWGWPLIDAQVENPHLVSLGAQSWPRERFLEAVTHLVDVCEPAGPWTDRFGILPIAEILL